MRTPDRGSIRPDLLTTLSPIREILRAMYSCVTDYLLLRSPSRERLLHKEQLVALMEQGSDSLTMNDLHTVQLKGHVSAKMDMEEISPSTQLLVFAQEEGESSCKLSLTTFGEFRESLLHESSVLLPDWWSVPLPLVYIDEDKVLLNQTAASSVPGGAVAMARQVDRMKADKIVTIKENGKERTLSLSPLGDSTFLIDDISGDFEMAEDLVWWAAVGRAFVSRMQGNGLVVRRLSPFEDIPPDAAEVIPCRWEKDLVGRLVISVPAPEQKAHKPSQAKAAPPSEGGEKQKKPASDAKPKEKRAVSAPRPSAASKPAQPSSQPADKPTEKQAEPQKPKPRPRPQAPRLADAPDQQKQPAQKPAAGERPAQTQPKPAAPKPEQQEQPKQEAKGAPDAQEAAAPEPTPAPKPEAPEIKKMKDIKSALAGETANAAPPEPIDEDEEEAVEPELIEEPDEQENLRKSAARSAYGIKQRPEVEAVEVRAQEERSDGPIVADA